MCFNTSIIEVSNEIKNNKCLQQKILQILID